jgi:hypothetical protein
MLAGFAETMTSGKGQLVLPSASSTVDAVVGFSNGQAEAAPDSAATAIRLANKVATSFFMQTPLSIIPMGAE